jgi:hypothetical protein
MSDHWDKQLTSNNKTMKKGNGVPVMKTTIFPPAKVAAKPVIKDGYTVRRWKGQFRLRITRKGETTYNSTEWYKNEKDMVAAIRKDIAVLQKYLTAFDIRTATKDRSNPSAIMNRKSAY